MTTPFIEHLKSKLKHGQLFGWNITDIQSLLRFSIRRVDDENLAQVAGSLTFTTVLALVPMLTVALAIFTAFPLFTDFRESLEAYFIQNLMPHALSENILSYLNQFAMKASRLSAFGAIALMATAVITLATIDHVFNQIWRVKQRRPLFKRMLVYWALITFAPLLIGVSLTVTSYLVAATSGVVGDIAGSKMMYTIASIFFTTCAFSLLYVAVPNRPVDWRDAAWGGLVASILFEIAKRSFAAFVMNIPTYTVVYGAIAVIPIFLIWIYTSWLITLFGAVIAASLPVVKYERWWHLPKPGSRFIDAVAVLEVLFEARTKLNHAGITSWEIRKKTRLGIDEIESLLMPMIEAGWVGRLREKEPKVDKFHPLLGSECWVLLMQPNLILMSHVYRLFLFEPQTETRLTKKVEAAIEQGLQESLEDYFMIKTERTL
jgi:membrane protein